MLSASYNAQAQTEDAAKAVCGLYVNLFRKNMYVNKKKSNGKVDGVVSLINAIYLVQQDVILNPEDDFEAIAF